ncbi:hypothetical protein COHA_006596 [Chlorella ohadii]|uniref:Uncharacterized protein n=1 Tax=Chlorella ohadii TaxID=2649997 RepID=A0AAD5H571_9CHLO|nr:hypothetical protein COHA_006596 [Chlorella ohadii]
MRVAWFITLAAVRRRATPGGDALERSALATCAAMVQNPGALLASPHRCLASSACSQSSDSASRPGATPDQPAAAGGGGGAGSGAATLKPRTKVEQFRPGMEDFVKQMFAADLDALPADEAAEAAERQEQAGGAVQQQQDPAAAQAGDAAAGEEAEAAAAAAAAAEALLADVDPAIVWKREKRLKQLLGGAGGSIKVFEAWLKANKEGVAAFRTAAAATLAQQAGRTYPARQAAVVEELVVWLFRAKRTHLLQPSERQPSKQLAQLSLEEAIALLTKQLGIRGGHVPGVLERCPSLLGRLPPAETLDALQELFGGWMELGAAVVHSPSILLMGVDKVKRRLEVLALLTHGTLRDAASLVAQYPTLLGSGESQLADNARFLGTLLPLRPYNTLLQRFPYLLSTPLERRLRGLQRQLAREAPELAALDLQLLVSQQPTLLLKKPAEVVAQWRLLSAAAARVPGWQDELAAMSAPAAAAQQAQQVQQAASSAAAAAEAEAASGSQGEAEQQPSEAEQWLADMLASLPGGGGGFEPLSSSQDVASSGGRAEAEAEGKAEAEEEAEAAPAWFHQDAAGEAAAAARGAFGTQQRPWADSDRLRARQLARLLDARRWQLLRLQYLGESVGAAAARRSLLDVVMAHRSAFEQDHPDFPVWLEEQLQREEEERLRAAEERERLKAERAAERAAARAEAAGGGAEGAASGDAAATAAAAGEATAAAAGEATAAAAGEAAAAAAPEAGPAAAAAVEQGQTGASAAQQ